MAFFNWRFSRRKFLARGSLLPALVGASVRRLLALPESAKAAPQGPSNIYERLGVRTRLRAAGHRLPPGGHFF